MSNYIVEGYLLCTVLWDYRLEAFVYPCSLSR